MKRTFLLLIALIALCLAMAAPVSAAGNALVVDNAGLLADDAVVELNSKASTISEKYECDVIVYIEEKMSGNDASEYAKQVYKNNGYGYGNEKSGVMLFLSMAGRDYAFVAFGYGNVAFTDYGKDVLIDDYVLPPLSDGDYYKGLNVYLEKAAQFLELARGGNPVDGVGAGSGGSGATGLTGGKLAVAVIIGLLIALIVCLVFRSQMKTARKQRAAANYIPAGGFVLTGSSDNYIRSTETRRTVRDDSSSKGGGTTVDSGGFSGKSGKF